MTGGLIDDEQRGFREACGCVGQIFTLKQIDENINIYAMKRATVKETKLKKEKKNRKFPFYALCRLGHRRSSTLQGFPITVVTHNCVIQSQGFIPRAAPHAFPLTNPRYSFLSWTIFLVYLISKPLFFKRSFTASIHLCRGPPTVRLPSHSYIDSLDNPIPLHPLHMVETPENSLINQTISHFPDSVY